MAIEFVNRRCVFRRRNDDVFSRDFGVYGKSVAGCFRSTFLSLHPDDSSGLYSIQRLGLFLHSFRDARDMS